MENSGAGSSNSVGVPLQRLASFKGPRDLSLGGVKLNKKVFSPNLNVSRNKGKGQLATSPEKKEEKNKGKTRKNDRPRKNGPNIIKSGGVFSEGIGASEKYLGISGSGGRFGSLFGAGGSGGGGGGGGGGSSGGSKVGASVLQRPTIRPNDTIKVDKDLEEECIRRAVGGDLLLPEEVKASNCRDQPVKLPIAHFRNLSVRKTPLVAIKPEPGVEDDLIKPDQKPLFDVKTEVFEDKDIISLLQSDQPTLILVQMPDCMPGQGTIDKDRLATDIVDDGVQAPPPLRCRLPTLAEGRLGKLRVHRSGRVRMQIGDMHYEVIMGTRAMHHQEVVSVALDEASRSARLSAVGTLQYKLTVVPVWEPLMRRKITIPASIV